MRTSFLWVAGVVVACSSASQQSGVGSVSEPIINGTKDTTHDAVVFIYGSLGKGSGAACTGTIVKTDPASKIGWVLTAAHCVSTTPPLVAIQGANIGDTSTLQFSVLDYLAHPSYDGQVASANDVAVIRILGIDAATPSISLTTASDGVAVGSSVTSVGYGRTETSTEQNPNEDRRSVTKTLSTVSTTHVGYSLSGSGICQGDSGGPVLFKSGNVERVVGVHSYVSGGCTGEGSGTGYSVRVSPHLAWIESRLALAAPAASCDLCKKTSNSGGQLCAVAYRTCEANTECKSLYDCVLGCASASACLDACYVKYPKATGPFLYATYCACEQACTSECSSSCITVPTCGHTFGKAKTCNACLDGACCKEGLDCTADGECYSCWDTNDQASSCASNAKRKALLKCQSTNCASKCDPAAVPDGGTPDDPPAEEPPVDEPPVADPPADVPPASTGCSVVATPIRGSAWPMLVAGLLLLRRSAGKSRSLRAGKPG